jgi:hypothetical protein
MVMRILCWTLLIVCIIVNIKDILESGCTCVVVCEVGLHCIQLGPLAGIGYDHWTQLLLTGQTE